MCESVAYLFVKYELLSCLLAYLVHVGRLFASVRTLQWHIISVEWSVLYTSCVSNLPGLAWASKLLEGESTILKRNDSRFVQSFLLTKKCLTYKIKRART